MRWSISKSKIFSQCQRKWYFSEIAASHSKKDPYRREIFLLKQLKSIHAWRGDIVDKVIEKKIIPEILVKRIPPEDKVIEFASTLIEKQIEFGKAQKFREPDMTKSKAGDIYTAFYDIEYNGYLDEKKLQEAINEIRIALLNLLRSNLLKEIAEKGVHIIAQRPLSYNFDSVTVTCTPDLIVFFDHSVPAIIDWKVHAYASAEYWLQLGVYSYILSIMKPHRDFPPNFHSQLSNVKNFRLIEYQLLKNQIREYSLSEEDIADIEDYIFESISQMKRLINGKQFKDLDINQFQTAQSPHICAKCEFKKVCWEDDINESN
jgi:hypothetical protein